MAAAAAIVMGGLVVGVMAAAAAIVMAGLVVGVILVPVHVVSMIAIAAVMVPFSLCALALTTAVVESLRLWVVSLALSAAVVRALVAGLLLVGLLVNLGFSVLVVSVSLAAVARACLVVVARACLVVILVILPVVTLGSPICYQLIQFPFD